MRPEEVTLQHAEARVTVSTLGATVLSYVPAEGPDILWLSPTSAFRPGTAIRGGIPVCWPWFAADPAHPEGPSHGLVRTRPWSVVDASETTARFSFLHEDESVFPAFRLELELRLGADDLSLALTHHNLSEQDASCSGALHSYLRANSAHAVVRGLGRAPGYDKVRDCAITVDDPIEPRGKIDLIVGSEQTAVLEDGKRQVVLHRQDAPDVVVWNPAEDRPGDVPVGGERDFLCVEAAAVRSPWIVAAGGQRTLGMRLQPQRKQ